MNLKTCSLKKSYIWEYMMMQNVLSHHMYSITKEQDVLRKVKY